MLRTGRAIFCTAALSAPASAEVTASLVLELGRDAELVGASYSCGGDTVPVQYINAGANTLALIRLDGEDRVFVNVIAASGARYVSGEYEWWAKGASATLRNRMDEKDVVECTSKDGPPQE